MEKQILELHNWRKMRPDDENELIVLFQFSLCPADGSGQPMGARDHFWTEVRLHRFLAEKPGWKALDEDRKIRAMFQYAQEQIAAAQRKLRHAHLFWTPTAQHRAGPTVDPTTVTFPDAPPKLIETDPARADARRGARAGAGL